jgi:hypothetical protein
MIPKFSNHFYQHKQNDSIDKIIPQNDGFLQRECAGSKVARDLLRDGGPHESPQRKPMRHAFGAQRFLRLS